MSFRSLRQLNNFGLYSRAISPLLPRRRIAHVLHEDLQQHLAAMQIKANLLKENLGKHPATQEAGWLLKELSLTIQISRDLTNRLCPAVLYVIGLRPALEKAAADMEAKFGLAVRIKGQSPKLGSNEILIFTFESVRELLMNVNKHAGVKAAQVRIQKEKKRLTIEVLDRGAGFDSSKNGEGKFGLFSIRERAEAFGGSLGVDSIRGKGTCVTLTLPIN